jgi:hypothetical protein
MSQTNRSIRKPEETTMPKYNEVFKLNGDDIGLIENALRTQVGIPAQAHLPGGSLEQLHGKLQTPCAKDRDESFKFNTRDIDLIEHALREEVSVLARINLSTESGEHQENNEKIRELEKLLGKLSNQKVWYGQVHHTGVPLG